MQKDYNSHAICISMAKKNLQIRLDENLKRKAEKIFRKIGIDTPTAIRIFFAKVTDTGGIPFFLQSADDGYTPQQILALDRLAARTKKGKNVSAAFSSVDELLTDLRA